MVKNRNGTGLRRRDFRLAILNGDKEAIVNPEYNVTGQLERCGVCSNRVSCNEAAFHEKRFLKTVKNYRNANTQSATKRSIVKDLKAFGVSLENGWGAKKETTTFPIETTDFYTDLFASFPQRD